jgi:BirA family biotin operon repressor/biotin-[acetyl-CoA-carboxylase] ligase
METGALRNADTPRLSSTAGTGGPSAPEILTFDEIDSTNAEARRRAEAGELGPLWIAARRQTGGRGRRGRPWETGVGNLAATLLIMTDKPPLEAAQVAFVAALAVADLAAAYVDPTLVTVKWPNDVLIAGRKVAGILVDSGALGEGRLWLGVGVGVNLASPPVAAERPATSFAQHLLKPGSRPPSPEAALTELASAFDHWISLWDNAGFGPVAEAWTARAHGLGRSCTARLERETLEGVALGLDADGALRLRLADGAIRRITAGDVFFADDGLFANNIRGGAA